MRKVRVSMSGPNTGEVFIDGEKVLGVVGVEFSASVDATPEVKITLRAIADFEGVADVTTFEDKERRFAISENTQHTNKLLQDILDALQRMQRMQRVPIR